MEQNGILEAKRSNTDNLMFQNQVMEERNKWIVLALNSF